MRKLEELEELLQNPERVSTPEQKHAAALLLAETVMQIRRVLGLTSAYYVSAELKAAEQYRFKDKYN